LETISEGLMETAASSFMNLLRPKAALNRKVLSTRCFALYALIGTVFFIQAMTRPGRKSTVVQPSDSQGVLGSAVALAADPR
jgi:hypothetical protein